MEKTERRQTLRHTFSKKDAEKVYGIIKIKGGEYGLTVRDLSLAGMNCYINKNAAEKIQREFVYDIKLKFNSKNTAFIKGQMMWKKPVQDSKEDLSVGFYNFIPREEHHTVMLSFLQELG